MSNKKILNSRISVSNQKIIEKTFDEIFVDYTYYPHSAYRQIDQSVLKVYFRDLCLDKISKSTSVFHHNDSQSGCKGIVWTSFQKFDTEQFGWRTENIEGLMAQGDYHVSSQIKKELNAQVIKDCKRRNVCYLSHRASSNDISTIHVLEESGFATIDGLLTFSLDLNNWVHKNSSSNYVFRPYREEDLPELKRIASESFMYDRFHSDPVIPKLSADRFHEVWIENSCRGLVDAVMVAEKDGKAIGFITCKINSSFQQETGIKFGSIVLVATDRGKRGKGVAAGLLNYVLDWFKSEKVNIVEVGTQIRNIPASRLYEKAGFRLQETSFFFRRCL